MTFLTLLSFLIMFVSCEKNEENDEIASKPDTEGNLLVRNYSTEVLALYRGSEFINVIWNSSEDFLVEIPNPNHNALDLRLYRYEDVKDNLENPNSDDLFKTWEIVLSADNEVENRATWFIRSENIEIQSGTLTFAYVGGTENQVDVFLDNKTGAKLLSLKPGDQYINTVGIDYENYTMHFRYWYSDQGSVGQSTELGWIEKEVVNGEEVDIWVVLNQNSPERHVQIPHWNGGGAIQDQYGSIKIKNSGSVPLQIWVGSQLIENIVYTNGQGQNSSTIMSNEFAEFVMKAGEYTFVAKNLQTTQVVEQITDTIFVDQQTFWDIQ